MRCPMTQPVASALAPAPLRVQEPVLAQEWAQEWAPAQEWAQDPGLATAPKPHSRPTAPRVIRCPGLPGLKLGSDLHLHPTSRNPATELGRCGPQWHLPRRSG